MATVTQRSSESWLSVNPILGLNEIGYDSGTGGYKVGNGTSRWNQLEAVAYTLNDAQSIAGASGGVTGTGGTLKTSAAQLASDAAFSGTYASLLQSLKGWALSQSFYFTGAPTVNGAGTITGGNIGWPDTATGVYTATTVDANGAVTAFTATTTGGPLGTKTVTVTIPRDASSIINAAMTVGVA